jgi:hypothetical protein
MAKDKDKPAREKDNPARDDFHQFEDDGRRFRIAGTSALGGHPEGKVVSLRDLGPGAQIQRLMDLGHLQEVAPEELEAQEAPEGMRVRDHREDPKFATGEQNPASGIPNESESPEAARAFIDARNATTQGDAGLAPGEKDKGGKKAR